MPPRRDPPLPAPEEEAPFQPSEPWWRKPLPQVQEKQPSQERSAGRAPGHKATRFETSTPSVVEKARSLPWPKVHVSGRVAAFMGVFVMMVAGLIVALTNENFAVTRELTTVRGLQRVAEDDVRRASQLEGTNIFRVQPGQVAKNVKQLPGVAEARVHVWLPAQIVIDIREYEPLVAWHSITSTVWLADTGAVVPMNSDPPPLKLVDTSGSAAEANGKLRPHVLANLKALQAAGLEVTNLFYGPKEGIYFRSPEGWTVYLGNEGQMPAKLAALQELRKNNIARTVRATTVDLRIDGRMQLR
jgi:cell division septal protein FtsQ